MQRVFWRHVRRKKRHPAPVGAQGIETSKYFTTNQALAAAVATIVVSALFCVLAVRGA